MDPMTQPRIRLAIIDDSLPLRGIMSRYLASQGFQVVLEATNGTELLSGLDKIDVLPDLCLLDTSMPLMDGYETARNLKVSYPAIGIMAFSFFDESATANAMLQCGAHDYVSKDASAIEVKDALIRLYDKLNRIS
jgi:DNA-binding NarL/FixJ family response regulator